MGKLKKIGDYLPQAVMFFMTVILLVLSLNSTDDVKLRFRESLPYADGWFFTENGQPFSEGALTLKSGQTIRISHMLPDSIGSGDVIGIRDNHFHITAEIGGAVVKELGKDSPFLIGHEIGQIWTEIPLLPEYGGSRLDLAIENRGKNRVFENRLTMYGSVNDLHYYIFHKGSRIWAECAAIFLLAVILLIYCFVLRLNRNRGNRKNLLYLASFALACGFWFLTDSDALQFCVSDPSIRYAASYFVFYCIPLTMILLFREVLQEGEQVLTVTLKTYCGMLLVILLLYTFNLAHISLTIPLIHVFLVFLINEILVLTVVEYRRSRKKDLFWVLIAFAVLGIGGIMTLLRFYTDWEIGRDRTAPFRYALFLFLIILFVTLMRTSMKEFADVMAVEHYKQLAYFDPVTGGHSRQYFEEQMNKLPRGNKRWFGYLNFCQFKLINEAIGREKGNQLLKNLYRVAEEGLTAGEMLCNPGNAAFAFYLLVEDRDHMHQRVIDLMENFQDAVRESSDSLLLQTELYGYQVEEEVSGFDEMLDRALMAKNSPFAEYVPDINLWLYNKKCRLQLLYEKDLTDGFRRALSEGEFQLYMQPRILLRNRATVGAEALVRWKHPKYGIIKPEDFIELFERNGMLSQMDLYLFTELVKRIKVWVSRGVEPPNISVNLSRAVILQEGYIGRYKKILEENDVAADYIEFEFSEAEAYGNYEELGRIIEMIHNMGSRCAMDNFEKSYSNLGALGKLNFDTVKLDKSIFDDGFPQDPKKRELVSGLIRFLKGQVLRVVAVGIQTREQAEALHAMGCDEIQGYYCGKPIPISDFERSLSL